MEIRPPIAYRIDRDDRLSFVSEGWQLFAAENDTPELSPTAVLGHRLWEFIADPGTDTLYRSMVGRVRRGSVIAPFRFRCDAPERRRLLQMAITAQPDDEVLFAVSSVVEESRRAVPLLDVTLPRSRDLLTVCSWCSRVRMRDGSWVAAEEAVRRLGLFVQEPPPAVSHGMCLDCSETLGAAITTSPDDDQIVTLGPLPPSD